MADRRLDLMIDLECAGPAPHGAIVSIGWCCFSLDGKMNSTGTALGPASNDSFGRYDVIVESCVEIGMKIDPDTIKWWLNQDPEVRRLWNPPGAIPVHDALRKLTHEYSRLSVGQPGSMLWAYPATYDLSILDYAITLSGITKAFDRRHYGCSRSVMKALGYRRSDELVPPQWRTKHLPENDAVRQAIQLQLCMNPGLRVPC